MTIPLFSPSGVLPPFVGDPAGHRRAPYTTTMLEVVRRLGTSSRRRAILRGLLRFRTEWRRVGVARGFQWLNGSFAENIPREPNDLDVVTCAEQWPALRALAKEDLHLFDPVEIKRRFSCDAYWLELMVSNRAKLVERVAYWYGLFSHRRITFEWKGIVQVDFDDEQQDTDALGELEALDT